MAGDSVVGALRVVLGMDTAQFEDGAKKAAHAGESLGKQLTAIAGGIALEKIVEKATHSLVEFAKSALETADALYKLSQRTGVPVEQLSGLRIAAELSEVSIEGLARAFKNMQIEMVKASSKGTGPAASAFAFLGLKLEDIKKAQPQDAFLQIGDAVSKLQNPLNITSSLAAIFGERYGPALAPLMKQGRHEIEETIATAQKLGLIVSDETAKNAEKFNDSIKTLVMVPLGVALTVLEKFVKGMADSAAAFVKWVADSGFVQKAAEVLVRTFTLFKDNLDLIIPVLKAFITLLAVQTIISFGKAMFDLAASFAKVIVGVILLNTQSLLLFAKWTALAGLVLYFTGNLDGFIKAIEPLAEMMTRAMPADVFNAAAKGLEFMGVNVRGLTGDYKDLGDTADKVKPRITITPKEGLFDPEAAKKLQRFNAELLKLELTARETGGSFNSTLAPGFVQAAMSLELIGKNGENLEKVLQLATPQAVALNDALLKIEGVKLTQEFLTPWQQYEQQLQKIQALLTAQPSFARSAALAQQKAALDMLEAYGKVAVTITTGFADAFKTIAEKNKQYAGIAKAAAIAQALAQTFVAANTAMAQTAFGGLPLQLAAAAAVTAAGLANVAKIASTDFATGGSFKVGGAGGIDSQLVQFNATPGEMVDVRKPGATGPSSEITIRGLGPREFFTGDMLRSLVEGLNAAHSDGYKLKVA